MSTPPLTTTVGADLYDAVAPLAYADESLEWPLATFVDCLGLMLEEEAQLVRADEDGNDGWSAFADPSRCPDGYLFTLAQWAGVRYPRRMDTTELRQMIGPRAPGLWRGTTAAITAAVQRYLTPGGQLFFEERADGDPYKLRIFTYVYDTLDQASIQRELTSVIPAGLVLDFQVRSGQSYAQLKASEATYSAAKAQYATYDVLHTSLPARET